MAGGSPQRAGAEFFTAPEQLNQRRYEALRAFFVDGLTHAQAAERFGYTRWTMVDLVHDYRAGKLELFAPPRKPGPPPGVAPAKDRARGRVIELRRQGLSTSLDRAAWTAARRRARRAAGVLAALTASATCPGVKGKMMPSLFGPTRMRAVGSRKTTPFFLQCRNSDRRTLSV